MPAPEWLAAYLSEDAEALRDFFQRYGFKTMLRDMGPGNAAKYGMPGAQAAAPADAIIVLGAALYALNLTNPDLPTPMWRITPAGLSSNAAVPAARADWYTELALTFSTPKAVQMRINGQTRVVLVVGGGYNGGRNDANQPLGKDARSASSNQIGTDDGVGNAVFIIRVNGAEYARVNPQ